MVANTAQKPSEMPVATSVAANDLFIISTEVGTPNVDSKQITAQNLFNNVQANSITVETLVSNGVFINFDTSPVANNDNMGGRKIWWDTSFLYVSLSNTEIRRIPLEVFS